MNRLMDLPEEGIPQAKEALEIRERLGDTGSQAECLINLAWLFTSENQLDAAEEAAFRAINLLPEKGEQHRVSGSHRLLGEIYGSKGEIKKAIHHYELALGIASTFNWHHDLFWVQYKLAGLFYNESRFDDANDHIETAKSHTVNSTYNLGLAMELQAKIWYKQRRLEEARSEILCAAQVYEQLGAARDVEDCRNLLQTIEKELTTAVASGQSGLNCEFL
jgi:tetratricopeptide (TPR) repeat protein